MTRPADSVSSLRKPALGGAVTQPASLTLLTVLLATLVAAVLPPTSIALPEGRVFEMVSPAFKGGYGANAIRAVALDGERVAFESHGAFAGASSLGLANTYVARRGASGWSTLAAVVPAVLGTGEPVGFSSSLEWSLAFNVPAPNFVASVSETEGELLLHRSDTLDVAENFGLAGMVLKTADNTAINGVSPSGMSSDFCHVVLRAGTSTKAPLSVTVGPQAVGVVGPLYDVATGCAGESSLRLVNVNNKGEVIDPYCPALLGNALGIQDAINKISADGSEIFFTTTANRAEKGNCDALTGGTVPSNPAILYARVAGEETLQVSAPLAADCASGAPCHSAVQRRATFEGASEDGGRVFFRTAQPLVTGDTDETDDVYMARIGCPGGEAEGCEASQRQVTSLVQVSHGSEPAEVQGVVGMAPDASRVYFVARGVLSEAANAQGERAAKGAENLYVYEPDPEHEGEYRTVFAADLCSGPERSGGVEDLRCPLGLVEGESSSGGGRSDRGLWSTGAGAQTAGRDGRFLVFTSFGRLIATGPQADTDDASDVYRYDAQSGALDRVSLGEGGFDANGNRDNEAGASSDATTNARGLRAVSEDGSRIVFTTAEPLSPAASNDAVNAYEWHREPAWGEGRVSLVSTGSDEEGVSQVVDHALGPGPVLRDRAGPFPAGHRRRTGRVRRALGWRLPVGAERPASRARRCLPGSVDESRAVARARQRLAGSGRKPRFASGCCAEAQGPPEVR